MSDITILINQKHKYGCYVACLAMLLNADYDDLVKKFFPGDLNEHGIYDGEVDILLKKLGYCFVLVKNL
jgi:predicted double-glycine peptidase